MNFSPEALALGQKLLEHHRTVCRSINIPATHLVESDVKRLSIRYGTLCKRAGLPLLTQSAGRFLYEVAVWCEKEGWSPINALVVNRSGRPGNGYDRAPGGGYAKWPEQVRNAITFKGYPDVMPD
jgi:hypothetical protein